jgi:1,2-diacylglycerol 3-alpha-glucosyltransferase
MRVVQVTPRYFPNIGGVEIVAQKISEALIERGHEVVVYSVDKRSGLPPIKTVKGVVVKRFNALYNDPLYFPEPYFLTSLRKEQADIIHTHNIHTFPLLIASLTKKNRQKLLLQPHYHRYGQSPMRHALFELYKKAFFNLAFLKSNAVLANSTYECKIISEDFPKAKNVILLPEGVDVNDTLKVKRHPLEPKRLLYVGALKHYKNVHKLFEGFAHLSKNSVESYRLVIVGDGPVRDSLVHLSSELGVSGVVDWKHGLSRRQLLDEYAAASVLVMLSPLESFSRVVYDALFIGVPVVVLNFGALKHLVEGGYAEGVNSLDKESVTAALSNALQKTYPRFSAHGESFLDWDRYVDRLVSIYQGLSDV